MAVDFGIVLGCPRSGTTFLMHALNTSPETACVSGIVFPAGITHLVSRDLPDEVYQALAVEFKQSLLHYLASAFYRSRARALQKWRAAPNGLRGLLKALKGEYDASRLIFKEPFLSLAPGFAWTAFPDAPFVYIYRDGRDCANSLVATYDILSDEKLQHLTSTEMRMGRKVDHRYVPSWVDAGEESRFLAASQYGRAIWMWKTMVERCHRFFSDPAIKGTGHVLWVRYEDFMAAPVAQGRRILSHLGLEPTHGFLKQVSGAHTRSIGKYRSRPQHEIDEAERIAGEALALYGYT